MSVLLVMGDSLLSASRGSISNRSSSICRVAMRTNASKVATRAVMISSYSSQTGQSAPRQTAPHDPLRASFRRLRLKQLCGYRAVCRGRLIHLLIRGGEPKRFKHHLQVGFRRLSRKQRCGYRAVCPGKLTLLLILRPFGFRARGPFRLFRWALTHRPLLILTCLGACRRHCQRYRAALKATLGLRTFTLHPLIHFNFCILKVVTNITKKMHLNVMGCHAS